MVIVECTMVMDGRDRFHSYKLMSSGKLISKKYRLQKEQNCENLMSAGETSIVDKYLESTSKYTFEKPAMREGSSFQLALQGRANPDATVDALFANGPYCMGHSPTMETFAASLSTSISPYISTISSKKPTNQFF